MNSTYLIILLLGIIVAVVIGLGWWILRPRAAPAITKPKVRDIELGNVFGGGGGGIRINPRLVRNTPVNRQRKFIGVGGPDGIWNGNDPDNRAAAATAELMEGDTMVTEGETFMTGEDDSIHRVESRGASSRDSGESANLGHGQRTQQAWERV
jgi:hypothetical protein